MEHFNHKINKLKKELVDITLNLNKFKTENHSTITRIMDNLSTIPKNSNVQTINKNNIEKVKYQKNNIPNNNHKKEFYTKKSISVEKKSQYPYYDDKKNCLSTNNLNCKSTNKELKRPKSSYLNNNKKRPYTENYKIDYIEEKNEDKVLYDENNNLQIDTSFSYKNNKYEDESLFSVINTNNSKEIMKRLKRYKEINNRFILDKENQNINNNYNLNFNYNLKKSDKDKDNIINIYSYNHNNNSNKNSNLNFNYNMPYNESLSKIENDLNTNKVNGDYLISNKNKKNLEPNIEILDLNKIIYNPSNKYNNKINNNLNNISQKIKIDNSFKKFIINNNFNDNNIRNNNKINVFSEKLLTNRTKDNNKDNNNLKDRIMKTNYDNYYGNENTNLKQIFKKIGVNNMEEAKTKIQKLKNDQKFYEQIEEIYYRYNREIKNYNSNNVFAWIYEISKYYSDFNYITHFEDIMKEHDINDLDQLKSIINDYTNQK